ncbi:hypothetical protein KAU08_07485, partial [bacterium]|nr:hypothetical protein [bacterium]
YPTGMKYFSLSIVISGLIIFFLLTPAVAQEGPDEWEPNNRRVLADEITGFQIEGEIGDNDHEDWYVLAGQQDSTNEFKLIFNEDECDITMEIYSGEELIDTGGYSYVDGFIISGLLDPCFIRVMKVEGNGMYLVEINPMCEGESEDEPNDDKSLADIIGLGTIEGYLCEDDTDWFKLDGFEGTNPTITLSYDYETCDIDCLVYSDDLLVGQLDLTISPDTIEFETAGTCYLYVYAFEGEGGYTIEIEG